MSALVTAARRYKGVRFRHRGRTERGLDCVGLGILAYRDCGVSLPDFLLYSTEPSAMGPVLEHHLTAALGRPLYLAPVRAAQLQPGDVIALRFAQAPHHVGIVGDYRFGGLSLIHAHGHTGRVVEQRLADDIVHRITHVYRRAV
jgi:cell wall-associated NlpC family hydrolase